MKLFAAFSTMLLLIFPGPSCRAENNLSPMVGETSFDYSERIKKELGEIINIQPEKYVSEVDQYREIIEKFIEHKKRVCSGEFSTMVLQTSGLAVPQERKKLGRAERKLCYREIKAFQITFINNMFQARKKYLNFLHTQRLQELEDSKTRVIKSLRAKFDPKNK